MPRRWVLLLSYVFVAALLSIIVVYVAFPEEEAPVVIRPHVETVAIDVDEDMVAGQVMPFTIQISPSLDAIPIDIMAIGTFGTSLQRLESRRGMAEGELPADFTRFAGAVTLRVQVDDVAAEHDVQIAPAEAIDPVIPLVGPRSIVADGQDWTMLVATPRDRYTNPVAEGTEVEIAVQHPGASQPRVLKPIVRHLLAWQRITSRTTAGKMFIGTRSGDAFSPERMVLEVPGLPVPFALTTDFPQYEADGRRLVRIDSEEIKDKYGNVLLDGTALLLLVEIDGKLVRSIPTNIVDGRIYATLKAPKHEESMIVKGWIAGVESEPLQVDFEQGLAVRPINVQVIQSKDSIEIIAGPILGPLNQYIPDGSEVRFVLTDEMGHTQSFIQVSDFGYSRLVIRNWALESDKYAVHVSVGDGAGEASIELQ